ncbi:asparagine synthase (glutamine-hydrolyzing) [Candidatus Latescibacterota bacterium]
MCGIAGIINFDGAPVDPSDLVRMADRLTHRGPDGEGMVYLDNDPSACRFTPRIEVGRQATSHHAAFAHRRLAIIDLSDNGIQPMSANDGKLWITYNGEIFNYIELRSELEAKGRQFATTTDTEVLLQAYDEWGSSCLDKLNGMWAFALWDTQRRRVFIARDRFGIKPLYFTMAGNCFAFASEPKALLASERVAAEPDNRAIADYLVHSRVDCFDWTFFKNMHRLEPGCYLDIGFNDYALPETRRWWNLRDSLVDPPDTDKRCQEEFMELLTSSIRLRLRSDVPVGTCLSGGLDSSAVVCIARPWLDKGNQKTYSAVYDPSFDEDETDHIDEIVRFSDVENYRVRPTAESLLGDIDDLISTQDEPFGSTSQYAQYRVFQTVREHGTTVTLDGQGADEELGGYHYMFPVHFAGLMRRLEPLKAWREIQAYRAQTNAPLMRTLLSTMAGFVSHRSMIRLANRYDPSRNINWVSPDITRLAVTIQPPREPGQDDWLNERLMEIFTVSSLPALLRYEDRNSMKFSIEARLPFMDHRLVSFLFSLPSDRKIRDGFTKHVMRDALTGVIPESIRTRTDKIGFSTPEAAWYRSGMQPIMHEVLGDSTTRKRGLYDTDRLASLITANASGKIDAGRALWRALNLELWFRKYID